MPHFHPGHHNFLRAQSRQLVAYGHREHPFATAILHWACKPIVNLVINVKSTISTLSVIKCLLLYVKNLPQYYQEMSIKYEVNFLENTKISRLHKKSTSFQISTKHWKDWAAEAIRHRIQKVKNPFRIDKVLKIKRIGRISTPSLPQVISNVIIIS